ncbi:Hypothetical protein IALB_1754 [Ignavibacterium album JCM 16511]|uniref:ABC transmembrane type-1 domain-containing protein n=1 Tax=Ignavibacterium album (strain DSM 19864 / JCM 16511 / NBRC 101810 / Mat9-16) TaxID=945713 RepID=I0AKF4_IGNAJ|nr:ABC transporter permease subunit [Ignavibacterium album]AFH49461.1 Hypothetical protein IALB_1754 [Ignavibacterium album JCM 16511]
MNSNKIKILIFASAAYVILFEFLFPANGFFPSVSVILFSATELFEKYNFTKNLISTFAAVYFTILVNYLIAKILFVILFRKKFEESSDDGYTITFLAFSYYIPFILIVLLILVWFPDFTFDKYVVAILVFLPKNLLKFSTEQKHNLKSYFYFYKSLGLKNSTILNKIILKLNEPDYFLNQIKDHTLVWSVVLITEFIQQKEGIGGILFTVFKYQDISLLFTVIILVTIMVLVLQKLLNLLYDKVYFWR